MKWLWFGWFAAGSGMVWFALLSPWIRRRPNDAIRLLIERFRKGTIRRDAMLEFPELSAQERAYLEQARIAGVTWTYRRFEAVRWGASVAAAGAAVLMSGLANVSGFRVVMVGAAAWLAAYAAPVAIMAVLAARRRTLFLIDISKYAHRLSICMSDKADIREMLVRAGRPLKLLQPHIHRLSAQWGNDQREAILAFKDGVGISEVFPLVNAFAAIARAKSSDVSRLLAEHSKSIDASLESELAKRIENAPVWISFYIMVPFLVCLLLFVYPWVLTVLEQLTVSFSAG